MTYHRDSSDVRHYNPARRAQALNFSDRRAFPIW